MTDPASTTVRTSRTTTRSPRPAAARAVDWPDFEARLAETLSRLPADQYLIVATAETRDRHAYFVQFAQCGAAGFHAEAVSNDYLPGPAQLPPPLERAMLDLGWQSPHRHAKKPQNYERQWPQATPFEEVAALAVRTLREVFGAERPTQLRYRRFARAGGEDIAEPRLGIARERAARGTAHGTPPVSGPDEPAGDLASVVGRALKAAATTARVEEMDHGAWRMTVNDLLVLARILPGDPPAVRIYAPVMRHASSPELLVALNELNSEFCFGRALHVNGEVMVAMEVPAMDVSSVILGAACEAVARMAIHGMTSITGRLLPVTPGAAGALLN